MQHSDSQTTTFNPVNELYRRQERFISISFLAAFIVLQGLTILTGSYRYVLYAVPLLAMPFYLAYVLYTHIFFFSSYLRNMLALYVGLTLYAVITAAVHNGFYERLLDELSLILLPLLFVQLLSVFYERTHDTFLENILLVGSVVTYFLEITVSPQEAFSSQFDYTLITTDFVFESGLSFTFAMLYIYFLLKGSKKRSLVCFLLTLLGYKRIAIAGVCVVSVLYFLLKWLGFFQKQMPRKLVATLALAVNLGVIFVIYQFIQGRFDQLIIQYFRVSANQLTAGRQLIYLELTRDLGFSLFGAGIGKTSEIMRSSLSFVLGSLHSDILKLYIEIGIVGFLPFLWLFYYINATTTATLLLAVFINIVWFTDNVIIYFQVMTVFYLLQSIMAVHAQHMSPQASNAR